MEGVEGNGRECEGGKIKYKIFLKFHKEIENWLIGDLINWQYTFGVFT